MSPRRRPRLSPRIALLAVSVGLHALVFVVASRMEPPPPRRVEHTPVTVTYGTPPPPKPAPKPPAPVRRHREPRHPQPATNVPAPVEAPDVPPVPTDSPGAPLVDAHPSVDPAAAPGPASFLPLGAPPASSLSQVRLFDPSALGLAITRSPAPARSRKVLERWEGGGGGGNDEESERRRVASRLGDELQRIIAEGNAASAGTPGCFDGIDQGFDDEIDCAAPGCAEHPLCAGTRIYDRVVDQDVPDDDLDGEASAIDVDLRGRVKAVSIKLRFRHASPGDLAIVLEAPDGATQVLRRADRSDPLYGRAFFAKELTGHRAAGRWRLRLMDVIAGVQGRFEGWQLIVTPG